MIKVRLLIAELNDAFIEFCYNKLQSKMAKNNLKNRQSCQKLGKNDGILPK